MTQPDFTLTEAERETLGRALSTRQVLVHVTHNGPFAAVVERIIADRVSEELDRITDSSTEES